VMGATVAEAGEDVWRLRNRGSLDFVESKMELLLRRAEDWVRRFMMDCLGESSVTMSCDGDIIL
jgi:hypothetical protein